MRRIKLSDAFHDTKLAWSVIVSEITLGFVFYWQHCAYVGRNLAQVSYAYRIFRCISRTPKFCDLKKNDV